VSGTSQRTVLIVEDEPGVRELVAAVLEDLGFSSLAVADGQAGLEILQAALPIGLLIADIGLPDMNGLAMVERARVLRPGLKILFMTGDPEISGLREPGAELISKPFSIDALAAHVRQMLDN
jgi:DNA-binding response OmpR family regulator